MEELSAIKQAGFLPEFIMEQYKKIMVVPNVTFNLLSIRMGKDKISTDLTKKMVYNMLQEIDTAFQLFQNFAYPLNFFVISSEFYQLIASLVLQFPLRATRKSNPLF